MIKQKDLLTIYNIEFELPAYTSIGGYPLFYLSSFSKVLCYQCATKLANDEIEDVVAHAINYEDEDLYCGECGCEIECAYMDKPEGEPIWVISL